MWQPGNNIIKVGFLKEHSRILALLMWMLDLSIPAVAAWVAFWLYPDFEIIPQRYYNATFIGVIGFALVFPQLSFGRGFRGMSITREIQLVSAAIAGVFISLMLIALVTKTTADYSRAWFFEWFVLTWLALVGYRVVLRLSLRWMRSSGFNQRSIIIIGSGEIAKTVIGRVLDARWSGFQIKGVYSDDEQIEQSFAGNNFQQGSFEEAKSHVEKGHVDQVWIAIPLSQQAELQNAIESLKNVSVDVRYIPDLFGFNLFNHTMSSVAGLPVINLTTSPMDAVSKLTKAVEDKLLAFIILLFSSPVMLVIALAVKFTSKGPIFFKQERLGWNGKKIQIYKFRTMPIDAEDASGPVWATKSDDRATPIGRFLRRTSLDEFPQFYNVLRGDMSIVGPRPERPMFVEQFKKEIPLYHKRTLVKAGITGWAQVNGWRGDTCLQERIKHDLYYIENWSIFFDIKIIFLTIARGFIHKNAY